MSTNDDVVACNMHLVVRHAFETTKIETAVSSIMSDNITHFFKHANDSILCWQWLVSAAVSQPAYSFDSTAQI